MKNILAALFILSTFSLYAQPKIKESEVPKEVLLALENTYASYKVKNWYQESSQYIADLVVDGQEGKAYFTSKGSWQYSSFPVQEAECPTLMMSYFINNYPGFRSKRIEYIEEQSGDNYYRMIISKKGIGSTEYELVFDTRGKLLKSNAPDPESVKKEYLARTNPEDFDPKEKTPPEPPTSTGGNEKTSSSKQGNSQLTIEAEENNPDRPTEAIQKAFNKRYSESRIEQGPEWIKEDTVYIARFINRQEAILQLTFLEDATLVSTMTELFEERYPMGIIKYLDNRFKDEKYKIEKICRFDYDVKYRDPATGLRPKTYFYVVVSQKVKGQKEKKITRLTFDTRYTFTGLLAEPIDRFDKVLK